MKKGYKAYQQIGTLLIKEGLINESQLQQALERQKHTKSRLGNILVDLNYVTQSDIFRILGEQLNIEFEDSYIPCNGGPDTCPYMRKRELPGEIRECTFPEKAKSK